VKLVKSWYTWHIAFQLVRHGFHNLRYIATKSVLWRLKWPNFVFSRGLRPRPRWGSSLRSSIPPIRLGIGIPTPHSPSPRSYGVSFCTCGISFWVGGSCSKDLEGRYPPGTKYRLQIRLRQKTKLCYFAQSFVRRHFLSFFHYDYAYASKQGNRLSDSHSYFRTLPIWKIMTSIWTKNKRIALIR